MEGQFDFRKFAVFIKSFWGILAALSASIPLTNFLLNAAQIQLSELADYYVVIPTTFAVLSIPFTFLYEKKLSDLISARKRSMILGIAAFILMFSFIIVKNYLMGDKSYTQETETELKEYRENKNGLVQITTTSLMGDQPANETVRINSKEIISLLLYTIGVVSLTSSFSVLGVFYYRNTRASSP